MQQQDLNNRFTFHPVTDPNQGDTYSRVRSEALRLAEFVDAVAPDGREKSLAVTHIEEAVFWTNAAIARAPGNPAVYAGPQYGVEKRLA